MKSSDELQRAKVSCFRLLKVRPRSSHELQTRLAQRKFNAEVIHKVITELQELNFIDDAAFARLWVSSRIKKPLGIKRLIFELKAKGIAPDVIEEAVREFDSPQQERQVIKSLIEKRKGRFSGLDTITMRTRLFGFLLRRGFSKELIYEVLGNYED